MNAFCTRTLASVLFVMVTFVLTSSFALHAVQVPHSHFSDHGSSNTVHDHEEEQDSTSHISTLGEHMHASEKKILQIALAVVFLFTFFHSRLWLLFCKNQNLHSLLLLRQRRKYRVSVDHHVFSLARGIIHTKAF